MTEEEGIAIANERIRECLETKSEELDLSGLKLRSLNYLRGVEECTHVTQFDVSNNNIETLTGVQKLKKLEVLFAKGNFIKDISPLTELKQLYKIRLSDNIIRKINPIKNLNQISIIDFGLNHISDLSPLKELKGLTKIVLTGNSISDLVPLEELTDISEIYLDGNQISNIKPLEGSKKLSKISFHGNRISDLNPLKSLSQLSIINAVGNQISDLRPLSELKLLKEINFNNNKISDLSPLKCLKKLNVINLSDNQIIDISPLEGLQKLNVIDLDINKISNLNPLKELKQLKAIYISDNLISNLKPLKEIQSLHTIILKRNYVSSVDSLKKLYGLNKIDIQGNSIKKIPSWLIEQTPKIDTNTFKYISSSEKGLYIAGNPISTPPIEILEQGREAALAWYAANKKELKELKVILIGEPGAGKTSLLKQFQGHEFDPNEKQTDGINIVKIPFGEADFFKEQTKLHSLTGRFWDFGGQEIMNASHQFFLTRRSVYLLLLEARKDKNVAQQVRQWLKRIRATGGDSPVLVVVNQIDVNPGFGFENQAQLEAEFPQIVDFFRISCAEGIGMDELKSALETTVSEAEFFKTDIDERWIQLKENLESETKENNYLSEERLIKLSKEAGIEQRETRQQAIEFLHDLGLALHFEHIHEQQNRDLANYFVLDPSWITYGVYRIVTSKRAGQQKGEINIDKDLDYILNEETEQQVAYEGEPSISLEYTKAHCDFLVEILHEFKLCFRTADRHTIILPDLLDTQEPEAFTQPIRQSTSALRFVYSHEYLPSSVLPEFMVDSHTLIQEKWRTGCLLEKEGTKALVETYNHKLWLFVEGEAHAKSNFMAVLRHKAEAINAKLASKPKRLVPLPGEKDKFVAYEVLQRRQAKGKEFYIMDEDLDSQVEFSITELLFGLTPIDHIGQLKEIADKILHGQSQFKDYQKELVKSTEAIKHATLENKASLRDIKATAQRTESNTEDIRSDIYSLRSQLNESIGLLAEKVEQQLDQQKLEADLNALTGVQLRDLSGMLSEQLDQRSDELKQEMQAHFDNFHAAKEDKLMTTKLKLGINLLFATVETEYDLVGIKEKIEEKFGRLFF